MPIIEISGTQLLAQTRSSFGLPDSSDALIDEQFLVALVRRAAGILCPCSASTLACSISDSLNGLTQDPGELMTRIEEIVDQLVVIGDLLELNQVTTDDAAVKGTWLFAAPPAFIPRPAPNRVYLVGIASDDTAPLSAPLMARVRHQGALRVLNAELGEDLPELLLEYGLVQLSEQSWLKLPRSEPASALRDRMERQLREQSQSGEVTDLLILDGSRSALYYRGRWIAPKKQSGLFVARRPQAFGAPVWGFALLETGALTRFLDFPLRNSKWRGCDGAWYLQMAIDHCAGTPQQYRRRPMTGGTVFDFFSPLPLWAERRLRVIGHRVDADQCLFSFMVPDAEVAAENEFLRNRLWLECQDDLEGN
jgi:hypothetical protein